MPRLNETRMGNGNLERNENRYLGYVGRDEKGRPLFAVIDFDQNIEPEELLKTNRDVADVSEEEFWTDMSGWEELCRAGHIGDFDVFVRGNVVVVTTDEGGVICRHEVPVYDQDENGSLQAQLTGRLRLWRTPDEEPIVGLVTEEMDNGQLFGYALNLRYTPMSEWGYIP